MRRTLEQLEGENWGDPGLPPKSFVDRCLALRRKPIDRFSVEDLRLMIGQDIGTKHLMPYALDALETNPFAEGDFYPGDLLASALGQTEFWRSNPDLARRMVTVARRGLETIERNEGNYLFDRKLRGELRSFIWSHERAAEHITTY